MSDNEPKQLHLLYVEDDPVAADLVQAQLDASTLDCKVECRASMSQALEALEGGSIDVVLLDLMLPDSHGLDGLELLRLEAEVPIIVVTSQADEALALEALSKGAQDYLFKGEISSHAIIRSVRYAVERHRLTNSLRELSLVDELTGLYNRRGFTTLARQQLKVAERQKRGAVVILADIDEFKQINDTAGHIEGDRAIQLVAEALEHTFRAADIIARWGGDEFVILGLADQAEGAVAAAERLEQCIDQAGERPYPLKVSLGVHWEDKAAVDTLDAMLSAADRALYIEKARRKQQVLP